MTFKAKVNIAQALFTMAQAFATIIAIIVAGAWTYKIFIKERREYPHANIDHKFSHVALSEDVNLVRVGIELTNNGNALMKIKRSTIQVKQILPLAPCASADRCGMNEVGDALRYSDRQNDSFSWPLIASRKAHFAHPVEIEPGEKQSFDYEFVMPSHVKLVRISAYFPNESKESAEVGWLARISRYFSNESKVEEGAPLGWATSNYYDINVPNSGVRK